MNIFKKIDIPILFFVILLPSLSFANDVLIRQLQQNAQEVRAKGAQISVVNTGINMANDSRVETQMNTLRQSVEAASRTIADPKSTRADMKRASNTLANHGKMLSDFRQARGALVSAIQARVGGEKGLKGRGVQVNKQLSNVAHRLLTLAKSANGNARALRAGIAKEIQYLRQAHKSQIKRPSRGFSRDVPSLFGPEAQK